MMGLTSAGLSADVSKLSTVMCHLMTEYILRNVSLGNFVVRTSVCAHTDLDGTACYSPRLYVGHLCYMHGWSLKRYVAHDCARHSEIKQPP